MSVISQIQLESLLYTVAEDETVMRRGLISGMVRDETTGENLRTDFTVIITRSDVYVRTTGDGFYGITGFAERLFPALTTTSYDFDLTVRARGYREAPLTVHIPQNATLPVNAPVLELKRVPVRLQGRVVEDDSSRNPIPGARVITTGGPSAAERTVALRSALYFSHRAGVEVRECQLTPTGSLKRLAARANAGERAITLNNRSGLAASDVVSVGVDQDVEFVVIRSLEPLPADPNQPGRVTLQNPLNRSFPEDAAVRKVTPGFPLGGVVRQLTRESEGGDGLLLVDGDLNVNAVEVADPVPDKIEYHAVGALADADGFYRLDGVARVRSLDLDASAAGFTTLSKKNEAVKYEQPINVVNFRLSP